MIHGNNFLEDKYSNMPEENIQSSGMDLNLGNVYELKHFDEEIYCLGKNEKCLPKHITVLPEKIEDKYMWKLLPHTPYILEVKEQIDIQDSAQIYFPRSTLLRAGIDVMTALGDKGYSGTLSFLAYNYNDVPFYLEIGVRFAQLIDCEVSDSSISYDGSYQNDKHKV